MAPKMPLCDIPSSRAISGLDIRSSQYSLFKSADRTSSLLGNFLLCPLSRRPLQLLLHTTWLSRFVLHIAPHARHSNTRHALTSDRPVLAAIPHLSLIVLTVVVEQLSATAMAFVDAPECTKAITAASLVVTLATATHHGVALPDSRTPSTYPRAGRTHSRECLLR